MRANVIYAVTLKQDVAYILIRFLCNTGSRDSDSQLRQNLFFDPDSDSSKILFSTLTLIPTPRKNLRLPRLRLPTPQHCCKVLKNEGVLYYWCLSCHQQT